MNNEPWWVTPFAILNAGWCGAWLTVKLGGLIALSWLLVAPIALGPTVVALLLCWWACCSDQRHN